MTDPRVAIIDVGSNSIRLVVFAAADRPRDKLVNEKVMAGLGRPGEHGQLPVEGRALAIDALKRFRAIADDMGIDRVHAFATAAVREAADRAEFVREVERLGFECTVIGDHAEAELAAMGVLVGLPDADGLVADLGGGSLDLAWVGNGGCGSGVSLPLGVLRVTPEDEPAARAAIAGALDEQGLGDRVRERPLHLVGGSFRTLARIDRGLAERDAEKVKGYRMAPPRAGAVRAAIETESERIAQLVEDPRLKTSPTAAMLLEALVETAQPSEIIVSGTGVREGFLGLVGHPLAFARVLG